MADSASVLGSVGGSGNTAPRLLDRVGQAIRARHTWVKRLHETDPAAGAGAVALPEALQRRYPNAAREWGWQQVFPATRHDDIRTIQELLGHRDVATTTIQTHVLNRGGRGVRSPLDEMR